MRTLLESLETQVHKYIYTKEINEGVMESQG